MKLLDCDTITQAKHKLQDAWYKGCAVSRRVSVDMLDLRLLGYNNDNGMTLSDDDGSNKCEGDWKRLNTLRHYKVKIPTFFKTNLLFNSFPDTSMPITHYPNLAIVRCVMERYSHSVR